MTCTRLADGATALNAFALDQPMRTLLRAMQRIDWQMGRLLRTVFAVSFTVNFSVTCSSPSGSVSETVNITVHHL